MQKVPAADRSDLALRENQVIRIYDIVFDYENLLGTDRFYRQLCRSEPFQKTFSTAEFHYLVGKYLAARDTPEKRKRFRETRRRLHEASDVAQKSMTDARGLLNPGLMLGTGLEYRIWKNLWAGVDFRYNFTGGDFVSNVVGKDPDTAHSGEDLHYPMRAFRKRHNASGRLEGLQ